MFGHLEELVIILLIGLLFFGPEKLPEVAANAGKMLREVRRAYQTTMNTVAEPEPDDFTQYYYESLARSGETVPQADIDEPVPDLWPGIGGTESVEMAVGEPTPDTGAHEPGDHTPSPDASHPGDATA